MRRELAIISLATALAHADTHVLVAADSYVATAPGTLDDDVADVAVSGHLEWKTEKRSAVIDVVDRESLIAGAPRRELHELSYIDRSFAHWTLTVGRFRVPGGYWLIADGIGIARRWGSYELGVFGGNRSFTNSRVETLLTASPAPIPLVGASFTRRGELQYALAYTLTKDRLSLYRGDSGGDIFAKSEQPEQFVDAEMLAGIGKHDYLTAGANVGSRYLVTYSTDPVRITDNPAFENVWFGSQALYALFDHRAGPWRLDTIVAALRTELGTRGDPAWTALTGSFGEGSFRASWLADRDHLDARYRGRVYSDGGSSHRVELAGEVRRGAFDLDARAGFDLHHAVTSSPGYTSSRSFVGRVAAGIKTPSFELLGGVAAVDTIVDELEPLDDGSTRAPYTLEARSYGFAHVFTTENGWFGGLDLEADLHGNGIRGLAQLGYAR